MKTSSIRQIPIKLDQEVSITFNLIPACPDGFLMGDRGRDAAEEPIHRVAIIEDFWMGQMPVTQAQFAVWTRFAGIDHKNGFQDKPNHPAENMTWHRARDYCSWLSERFADQLPTEHRFATLPTEAQWEYACRAKTTTEYHTGDAEAALGEAGWFNANSENSAHPVGELQANAFGLHDMHGNVWEWCLDRWDAAAYRRRWNQINEEETFALNEEFGDQSENPSRVMRGGSWVNSADGCRSAFRYWYRADYSGWYYGFRVCLVRSPIADKPVPAKSEQ